MLGLTASPVEDPGYVAHEWGTFTSVQGADGEQIVWNPLIVSELPEFVYDHAKSAGKRSLRVLFAKTAAACRQRLETPVIYFYSPRALRVDASVWFPSGRMTEWYPRATSSPLRVKDGAAALRWSDVEVIPRGYPSAAGLESDLPLEKTGSHYYAAREAEADFVRVKTPEGGIEVESLLFYRGAGDFAAPLEVTLPGPDESEVHLRNAGEFALPDLFLYRADGGTLTWQKLPALAPGKANTANLRDGATAHGSDALAADLRGALVRAGLFEKEAAAMVKTWESSWFAEQGTRVLYVLPRSWVDGVLPLKLDPAPKALERVMVGRAEILRPSVEKAFAAEVQRYLGGDKIVQQQAIDAARSLGLGRFAEAALRRLMLQQAENRELSAHGWEFLVAVCKIPDEAPLTAGISPAQK